MPLAVVAAAALRGALKRGRPKPVSAGAALALALLLATAVSTLLLVGTAGGAAFATGGAAVGRPACRGRGRGLAPRYVGAAVKERPPKVEESTREPPPTAPASLETRLYDVLGISKDATVSEIKKAYYREARTSHPDLAPGDEAMFDRFQEVAEAYQTLADPVRRQQYDLQGLAGLAYFKTNATRLFGPPPWQVMIGKTDHWLWAPENRDQMIKLLGSAIPNGIAEVTFKTIAAAYDEANEERVAVLMPRISEEQAKDTVLELQEYGLAVKAEPLEGERSHEQESPLMHFRRIQRELGEASENLRQAAIDFSLSDMEEMKSAESYDSDLLKWVDVVKSLRSELRAAAQELEEFKLSQVE